MKYRLLLVVCITILIAVLSLCSNWRNDRLSSEVTDDGGREPSSASGNIVKRSESDDEQVSPGIASVTHETSVQDSSDAVGLDVSGSQDSTDADQKEKEDEVDYVELPQKVLQPASHTRLANIPSHRLVSDNRERLEFINRRRASHGLGPLSTLPTGLNTEEMLRLINAHRVDRGLAPLVRMPTGGPGSKEY